MNCRSIAWLVFFLVASLSHAQQVGDTVIVVTSSTVDLKMESQVVGSVPRGTPLAVEEIRSDGFRVRWSGVSGWIKKTEAASIDDALALFDQAISKKPTALDYFGHGSAWFAQGKYDKAIADFSEAIRLDPNCVMAYGGCAAVYARTNHRDLATRRDAKSAASQGRGHARAWRRDADKALADYTEVIRLDPKDAGAYLGRSQVYNQMGDRKKAVADLATADRLASDSLRYCEWIGVLWIGHGEYDKGIERLQTAIRLNPKDPAATFEAWPKAKLSAEAVRHGEQQVRQMLKDRPAMARYDDKAKPLYQWAARKFAGEDLRQLVHWNNDSPQPHFDADHRSPRPEQENSGYIRVRRKHTDGSNQGKERPFEALWSNAVFELYNITNVNEFMALYTEGGKGKMPRLEYVTKAIAIESRAAEKTRAFYLHVFLPWAKEHRVASRPEQWFVGRRPKAGQNLVSSFVTKDSHYWRHYEREFDCLLLRSLLKNGSKKPADKLAAKLLEQASMDAEKAAIIHQLAYANAMAGNNDAALKNYSEAIRLDPKDAKLYYGRACIYYRKGENDSTIEDCNQAIRLDPTLANAYGNRGVAYLRKQDTKRAIEDITAMLRLQPKEVNAYIYRGIAYGTVGDYDKAIADFDKALEIEPTSSAARQNRANAYLRKATQTSTDKAAPETDARPTAKAVVTPTPNNTAASEVRIIFGGDVMLDGGPGHAILQGQDPFADVASLLKDADLAVCNLECVLARGGRQVLKSYTFRGPKQAVPLLKQHFSAVCLANNHTGDFGPEGFVNQLKLLDEARLPYFGGGRDSREARRPLILECKGLRIALLGRNGYPPRSFAAGEKRPGVAWLNDDELIEDIRAARQQDHADVVIPFLHWGREMSPEPTDAQRKLARRLIDAGATAVIGGHPHVTQTVEIYRGQPIVYSLGNFVFDYYTNDPPVWIGWLAELTVRRSGETDLKTHAFKIDPAGIPHRLPRR